ncbi:unnamed protein product [Trichobilharzia szidati]|nr:unnamed protein product [Trichobilharzia szidati]
MEDFDPAIVLWNKLGLDYPLTIGKNRFIPDERFHVQYKPPNRWHLVIANAQLNDTGVYSCTTGSGLGNSASNTAESSGKSHSTKEEENLEASVTRRRQSKMKITDDTAKRKLKGREYYVSVVEPLPSERYQVDVPISKTSMKNKTITVTGPNLVFYGTPLELICRASFPSSEAKLDPTISLEWYHRGIRRLPNPYKSGGVYITLRWLDSHLLESRLFIAWASEAEAGQWICLERSNPIKNVNLTKMSPNYHKLEYMELNSQSPAYLNKSVTYSPSRLDFVYDKIYIEIIVPTLSSSSSASSSSSSMSFSSPLHSSSSSSSTFNRKFIRPNILSETNHFKVKNDAKLSFVERLIRSMNYCTRLQVNKDTFIVFILLNCYFYTSILHHIL